MPGIEQLRHVKAGDRPSASQHNILVDAAKAKQAGANAFDTGRGYSQRPDAMKFSRVAQFRVDEDPPDPIEARQYITCVEIDDGNVVSDPVVISLTPQTAVASHLYVRDMLLFAAEIIDDFNVTDDDGKPVRWLEIVPPATNSTWATISGVFNDYLVCRVNGSDVSSVTFMVAKPKRLRHAVDGYTITSVDANHMTVSDGDSDEEWYTTPPYEVGDLLRIDPFSSGLTIGGNEIFFMDLNIDGRIWVTDDGVL